MYGTIVPTFANCRSSGWFYRNYRVQSYNDQDMLSLFDDPFFSLKVIVVVSLVKNYNLTSKH